MKQRLAALRLAIRFYVVRSVALDIATLRMRHWPMTSRLRFLLSKAPALVRLAAGGRATLVVGRRRVMVHSLADVGTVQASLADVHDDLLGHVSFDTAHPVVVDVGANMGQFTTAIKAFWPSASVLAFEPDPVVHARLADSARRLGGVDTVAIALGSEPATLPLHRHALSAMSTLRPGLIETYDASDTVLVPVARLDDVTADLPAVQLLKVDVEGFEVEVLKGAPNLLRRTSLLLVEVSLGRADTSTEPEVLSLVQAIRPEARVVRRGRPIGGSHDPICQDVLVDLTGRLSTKDC